MGHGKRDGPVAVLVTIGTNGQTHECSKALPFPSRLHLLLPCLLPEEAQGSIVSFPNYVPWEKPKESWVKAAVTVPDALEAKVEALWGSAVLVRPHLSPSHEPSPQLCPTSLEGHKTYHLMNKSSQQEPPKCPKQDADETKGNPQVLLGRTLYKHSGKQFGRQARHVLKRDSGH